MVEDGHERQFGTEIAPSETGPQLCFINAQHAAAARSAIRCMLLLIIKSCGYALTSCWVPSNLVNRNAKVPGDSSA